MTENIHRNALQPGFQLHWYRIDRILGQGGFGITYLAHDSNLDQQVAIKEYLPVELAVRERDFSVHPVSEQHGDNFRWGLDRFITEARTLAKFDHPNIVRVLSVFEKNNTAYMVMRYEQGQSLQELLPRRGTLEEARLMNILFPILGGLGEVHAQGFIHRDIKPANIFIREDGSPVLLDFGSARQSLGQETKTLTTLVSPGYAPFEQYYSKSDRQGPWTDIYGLAATLYRATVGVAPMDAVDRSEGLLKDNTDTYVPAAEAAAGRYSKRFLDAIDLALRFREDQRPRTVHAWLAEFGVPDEPTHVAAHAQPVVAAPSGPPPDAAHEAPGTHRSHGETHPATGGATSRRAPVIALAGAGLLALLITAYENNKQAGRRDTAEAPSVRVAPAVEPTEPPPASPSPARRINALLHGAERDIEALRLSTPRGHNAVEKLREVLALEPENTNALEKLDAIVAKYVELGEQAAEDNDLAKAQTYLERALELAPDSRELHAVSRQIDVLRLVSDAKQAARHGELARAGEFIDRALELAPENRELSRWREEIEVQNLMQLGKQAAEHKNLGAAERYLKRALELAPDNKELQHYQRRLDKAVRRWRRKSRSD